ncbi:Protein of unknown function (DUF1501) [Fragilaria crotonensis]|nr:Protein of unknown function (DUF1501) [Fragilaria crotonensis]
MTLLDQYNSERSTLAFTDSERSRVVDASGQPCSQFAIHQDLEIVERLYKEADLAFFANTGVLNTPSDKYNYTFATKTYLFAHNTMQEEADRVDPFRVIPRTGILGRLCDVLGRNGYSTQPIAVEVSTVATVGMPGAGRDRFFASRGGPSVFYPSREGEDFDPRQALNQLNGGTSLHSSLFGETWSSSLNTALHDSEAMFEAVSNRGTDRDVFSFVWGFDHHQEMKAGLSERLKEVNDALSAFTDEMKARNVWDDVTTVITSDFGRTLTANSGRGSDHGWGGHYFAMGGSVKGGRIHGDYPADITDSSPLNLGRGRIIPTMSWESMLNPIFSWMGVSSDEDLNYCLPNRLNTGAKLLPVEEVLFGETWSASLNTALHDSEALFKVVSNVEILTDFPDGDYSQILKSIATLIASHEQRGTDRDVFYVRFGGFDHHQEMKAGLSERLKEVNDALSAFTDEMKARNVWDDVTTVITSDFGRTLTANSGRGSDHGWEVTTWPWWLCKGVEFMATTRLT